MSLRVSVVVSVLTAALSGAVLASAPPVQANQPGCDAIAYVSQPPGGGDQNLWLVDPDVGVHEPFTPADGDLIVDRNPVWNRQGTHLAWAADVAPTFNARVVTAQADGSDPTVLDLSGIVGFSGRSEQPTWSPDGTRLAVRADTVTGSRIVAVNPDGTDLVFISPSGTTYANAPKWSPDGRHIAYEFEEPDGTTNLRVRSANPDTDPLPAFLIAEVGGGADPTDNRDLEWSPDGNFVAWIGEHPDTADEEVYVAAADGTDRTIISSTSEPVGTLLDGVTWSPDSQWVAWHERNGEGTSLILRAQPDGSDRAVISGESPAAITRSLAFSPDGQRLVWRAPSAPGVLLLIVAGADGSIPMSITDAATDPTAPSDMTWRPRASDLDVSVAVDTPDDPRVDDDAAITITATSPCGAGSVNIDMHIPPCVNSDLANGASVAATTGTYELTNTVKSPGRNFVLSWTIPHLVGTETIRLNTTLLQPGVCTFEPEIITTTPTTHTQPDTTTATTTTARRCDLTPSPFTDVEPTSYAYEPVNCIYNLNITTGTSPTTYSPDQPVTREQVAAFIARTYRDLAGNCPPGNAPFTDIPDTSFATNDIDCLYQLGITTGTTPTTYSPNRTLTRDEMVTLIIRTYETIGGTCPTDPTPFTDVDPTSFAANPIACAYHLGITTGTTPTTFNPNNTVTRRQMSAFLARLWNIATLTTAPNDTPPLPLVPL